ncbi:MAG: hypothetical protein WCT26_01060 [Candidatus Buchananbacteria bacterium]|jgi:hypothetical protein
MFKETSVKTPEQEAGEQYQARLEEIKTALNEEIEVLMVLSNPLSSHKEKDDVTDEYFEAGKSLFTLLSWLKGCNRLSTLKAKLLENIRVVLPDIKSEVGSKGLPDISIPVLVWPKDEWCDESNNLGADSAQSNFVNAALFIAPRGFSGSNNNPLAVTGVILTSDSDLKSRAVHESMHFLDFNGPLRKAENRILEEIIAFRQQDNIKGKSAREKWRGVLSDSLEIYYNNYDIADLMPFETFRDKALSAMELIKKMDKKMSKIAVTQILLNCISLDDIEQWGDVSEEDLSKLKSKK